MTSHRAKSRKIKPLEADSYGVYGVSTLWSWIMWSALTDLMVSVSSAQWIQAAYITMETKEEEVSPQQTSSSSSFSWVWSPWGKHRVSLLLESNLKSLPDKLAVNCLRTLRVRIQRAGFSGVCMSFHIFTHWVCFTDRAADEGHKNRNLSHESHPGLKGFFT